MLNFSHPQLLVAEDLASNLDALDSEFASYSSSSHVDDHHSEGWMNPFGI